MARTSIYHLFPPSEIGKLPTWRFVLHFIAPVFEREQRLQEALSRLRHADLEIVRFPFGLEDLPFDTESGSFAIRIEVLQSDRLREDSLARYEADIWKINASMVAS